MKGLKHFKLSKRLSKAIVRVEKKSMKYQYKDKEGYNSIKKVILSLKGINERISKIEETYGVKAVSRKEAKQQMSQVVPELRRVVANAKKNIGINVMNRTKIGWLLALTTIGVVGAVAIGLQDEAIEMLEKKGITLPKLPWNKSPENLGQATNKFFKGVGKAALDGDGLSDIDDTLKKAGRLTAEYAGEVKDLTVDGAKRLANKTGTLIQNTVQDTGTYLSNTWNADANLPGADHNDYNRKALPSEANKMKLDAVKG